MKNLVSFLVLAFIVTFSTQAQKRGREKKSNLTIEQQITLTVKKMTLTLDLSEKQQEQIKPILMAKMVERKAAVKKRIVAREKNEKPNADNFFAIKNKQLDHQIMMRNSMKGILNKGQFERFEKMQSNRMRMAKNKMKKKKESKKE